MNDVASLQPKGVWSHFAALSAIPRISGHEAAAASHVQKIAAARGWKTRQDKTGNVLIEKPASSGMEGRVGVILQGHLDMVGQKTPESAHDFLNDPLQLRCDGTWVHAEGTTLGADNGIGVSLALALLEDDSLRHGPLAALFTVDEEVGLKGAANVAPDFLPGQMLINLDADREDELIIGCAGSATIRIECPVQTRAVERGSIGMAVSVAGLKGGHSGADIHLGRGNANLLLARLLDAAGVGADLRLASWEGGTARNAIPRQASATLFAAPGREAAVRAALEASSAAIQNEYRAADPGFALSVSVSTVERESEALTGACSRRVVDLLRVIPNGALRFCSLADAAVETSNNLAIVALDNKSLRVQCLARSLVDSAAADVVAAVTSAARLSGATCTVEGAYPGWQPAGDSALVRLMASVATRQLGRTARAVVVHGGLECGLLRAVRPELQCVAVGPHIEAMHSPDERLQVASVGRVYSILKEVLESV